MDCVCIKILIVAQYPRRISDTATKRYRFGVHSKCTRLKWPKQLFVIGYDATYKPGTKKKLALSSMTNSKADWNSIFFFFIFVVSLYVWRH